MSDEGLSAILYSRLDGELHCLESLSSDNITGRLSRVMWNVLNMKSSVRQSW
jgi:hypothetical protein